MAKKISKKQAESYDGDFLMINEHAQSMFGIIINSPQFKDFLKDFKMSEEFDKAVALWESYEVVKEYIKKDGMGNQPKAWAEIIGFLQEDPFAKLVKHFDAEKTAKSFLKKLFDEEHEQWYKWLKADHLYRDLFIAAMKVITTDPAINSLIKKNKFNEEATKKLYQWIAELMIKSIAQAQIEAKAKDSYSWQLCLNMADGMLHEFLQWFFKNYPKFTIPKELFQENGSAWFATILKTYR